MRKVSFLIAVCFVLAVMVVTISAQGPGRGAPPAPAKDGSGGAADLPGIMQNLAATSRGMGPKVTAPDAAGVATDLTTMATLFTSAQTAFNKEKAKEPADLAKAAADNASKAAKAAKGGTVDAATIKSVTDSCGSCHMAWRVKDASGAYKLKTN